MRVREETITEEIRVDGSAELRRRQISNETRNSCQTQNSYGESSHDTSYGQAIGGQMVVNIRSFFSQVFNDRAQNRAQHVSQNNEGVELEGQSRMDAAIYLNQSIHSHESQDNTSS